MNKNPFNDIFGIFNKLAPQQKVLIGGVSIVSLILLGILFSFLNEPNYSVIYSNLAQEDASKVLDHLTSQKIPYKIEDNGQTIKVPQNVLYETRLSLASKGIPNSGIMGYEIFDKSTMGMSEFMQKLNYKRAIEGELARTIMQQEGVEAARVHIVVPKKAIFKDDEQAPTASVVLKLGNSFALKDEHIHAISNLVANSIEGLKRNNVTILDTQGRLLSKEEEDSGFGISTSKQYEIKQSVEKYLARKAQSVLDNILGYGNSMVQVNADLNFDMVEKTMELLDPESQVAISEQTIKSENGGRTMADSSGALSENTTTNYEISKTIQKVIEGTGNVKRLSVATVINDVIKEVVVDGKVSHSYEPRSQDQLNKLQEIVRNAVGINEERNDQFSLVNIPFEDRLFDENGSNEEISDSGFPIKSYDELVNLILIVTGIIASLLLLKGLMKKLKNEKIVIGGTVPQPSLGFEGASLGEGEGDPQIRRPSKKELILGNLEDEITDDALKRQKQQDKIGSYVSKNPIEAAKLINAWLHEDEY